MMDFKARLKEALRPIIADLLDEAFTEVVEELMDGVTLPANGQPAAGKTRKPRTKRSPEDPDGSPAPAADQVASTEGAALADHMEAVHQEAAAPEPDLGMDTDTAAPPADDKPVTVARLQAVLTQHPASRAKTQRLMAAAGMTTLRGVADNDPQLVSVFRDLTAWIEAGQPAEGDA